MRHRIAGRKLNRTSAHRLAMMRNMSMSLIDKERLTTTLAKAKELRRFAERLVTLAKRETLHSRRLALRHVPDTKLVAKLFDTLSARYAQRPGGYTRIIKLGPRRGDHAEMAVIELVGAETAASSSEVSEEKGSKASATKAKAKSAKAAPTKKPTKRAPKKDGAPSKTSSKTSSKKGGAPAAKKTAKRAPRSKG